MSLNKASVPKILNASHFYFHSLDEQCLVYSESKRDSCPITSFADALKPAGWREQFTPFAQVIVNESSNEFILVRDHLGIRPLYYWYQSGKLIFGNTIADILNCLPSTPNFLNSAVKTQFAEVKTYSDETLYQGIYRVEPGHMIHGRADGQLVKRAFWQLEKEGETLYYADDRDYLDHFSALMSESLRNSTQGQHKIAAEFSAGIDSSTIYCTCAELGIKPELFMHYTAPNSDRIKDYHAKYENLFIEHYQLDPIHRITTEGFDPIPIFKEHAEWFAGPSPYIFEIFAHNIHRAVSESGSTLLLSGFGGDQGVSGHIPDRLILPSLIKKGQYREAWSELTSPNKGASSTLQKLNQLRQFVQYTHPLFNGLVLNTKHIKRQFGAINQKLWDSIHPYHVRYFKSLREAEWTFLQGPFSHEIRQRIEYSSIAAKKMGFEYRYPLLYPKLLEFFLSIPYTQKRNKGVGRYLIRRYLSLHAPKIFDDYKKKQGMGIFPATFDYFKSNFEQGMYQDEFTNLPFAKSIKDKHPHLMMIKTIQAFMLKSYLTQTA